MPGHKGFCVGRQSGSQQVAVILVALLGVALKRDCPGADAAMGFIPLLPRRKCR